DGWIGISDWPSCYILQFGGEDALRTPPSKWLPCGLAVRLHGQWHGNRKLSEQVVFACESRKEDDGSATGDKAKCSHWTAIGPRMCKILNLPLDDDCRQEVPSFCSAILRSDKYPD